MPRLEDPPEIVEDINSHDSIPDQSLDFSFRAGNLSSSSTACCYSWASEKVGKRINHNRDDALNKIENGPQCGSQLSWPSCYSFDGLGSQSSFVSEDFFEKIESQPDVHDGNVGMDGMTAVGAVEVRVPCRARGMPPNHNAKVRIHYYFMAS